MGGDDVDDADVPLLEAQPVVVQPGSIACKWRIPVAHWSPADFIAVCAEGQADHGPPMSVCPQRSHVGEGVASCPGSVGVYQLAWRHATPAHPHRTIVVSEPFLVVQEQQPQGVEGGQDAPEGSGCDGRDGVRG